MNIGSIVVNKGIKYLVIEVGQATCNALELCETATVSEADAAVECNGQHLVIKTMRSHCFSPSTLKLLGQITHGELDKLLREFVAAGVRQYHNFTLAIDKSGQVSNVPVSGKVIESADVEALVDSSLDAWLTAGRYNASFEKKLAEYIGVRHALTCNSGSSANLLAFSALTSPVLKERQVRPGDEVISVAASFPTTVNPLISYGVVPVFVDVCLSTYNIDAKQIERAVTPKTKAIMIAHTLGNTFDVDEVLRIARKYNLWVIEDCCDALGSTYASEVMGKTMRVGAFGDIATFSFYPAHHITMGEGGAVVTTDPTLRKIIESFRDWGRDCWCAPGTDNSCNCRYEWKLGSLPRGYDHKYTYSHIGFNLKITDMQAAIGLSQLERIDEYVQVRRCNFRYLTSVMKKYEDVFILPKPTAKADPSWFGYPITLRDEAPFSREYLLKYLAECKIGTRLLFGGNLTRQPYFAGVDYRVPDFVHEGDVELPVTDLIMNRTFWIGIYHGLRKEHFNYIDEVFSKLLR